LLSLLLIFILETALGRCAIEPDAKDNVVPALQTSIAPMAFMQCFD